MKAIESGYLGLDKGRTSRENEKLQPESLLLCWPCHSLAVWDLRPTVYLEFSELQNGNDNTSRALVRLNETFIMLSGRELGS